MKNTVVRLHFRVQLKVNSTVDNKAAPQVTLATHETFYKIDYLLGFEASLNKFKKRKYSLAFDWIIE